MLALNLNIGEKGGETCDPPEEFSLISKSQYKDGIAGLLIGLGLPLFHVVAMLPPGGTRAGLEECLRAWAARVDRFYLGRRWHSRPDRRMSGLAFFETRPEPHGHLIVRPPLEASPEHFEKTVPLWFRPDPVEGLSEAFPKPVTARGKMFVRRVGDGPADIIRVGGYATKEMEFRATAISDWKFVGDLSRR
ncbi:hypothetical protein MesoLj131b_07940 [Mesorhizobium sp. 131-2-5]|nr:hypothetical protein MesoLj131b_07940 [Mesorhizobium sp. 131-2-5]